MKITMEIRRWQWSNLGGVDFNRYGCIGNKGTFLSNMAILMLSSLIFTSSLRYPALTIVSPLSDRRLTVTNLQICVVKLLTYQIGEGSKWNEGKLLMENVYPWFILTYTDPILNKVCLWSQPIHSILNKVCLWSQLIQFYPDFIPHYPQSDHTIPSLTIPSKVRSTV